MVHVIHQEQYFNSSLACCDIPEKSNLMPQISLTELIPILKSCMVLAMLPSILYINRKLERLRNQQEFTQETEDMLWDCNVLDTTDPDKLQKAVFFYIGKVFCLRGGED